MLGSGGSGTVYLAEDRKLGTRWAVKAVAEDAPASGAFLLRNLSHPQIVRITDRFTEDGTVYLIMDYVRGDRLDIFRNQNKRNVKTAVSLMDGILQVLMYLHAQDPPVLYRDLKPTNLIVRDGKAVFIDFDAACLEGTKAPAFGTRGFAAPELAKGEAGIRSDIYSAGKVLFYLLPEKAPRAVRKVAWKAAQEDAGLRYADAEEMRNALLLAFRKSRRGRRAALSLGVIFLSIMLCLLLSGIGRAAAGRQYASAMARCDYLTAVWLRPEDETAYLALLRKYESEGRTAEGISVVRSLLTEEKRSFPNVSRRIGMLLLSGSPEDPSFRSDPAAAEQDLLDGGEEEYAALARLLGNISYGADYSGIRQVLSDCSTQAEAEDAETALRLHVFLAGIRIAYAGDLGEDGLPSAGRAQGRAAACLQGVPR